MEKTRGPRRVRLLIGLTAAAALLSMGGAGGAVADRLLTGRDIENGTITSADVKDRSLRTKDLAATTVKALRGQAGSVGATGPAGPAGPAGATGPAGPPGPAASSGQVWQDIPFQVTGPRYGSATLMCGADERVVTGGFDLTTAEGGMPLIYENAPLGPDGRPAHGADLPPGGGWRVTIRNASDLPTSTVHGTAYLICARP